MRGRIVANVSLLALMLVVGGACSRAERPQSATEGEKELRAAGEGAHEENEPVRLGEEAIRAAGLETAAVERRTIREEIRSTAVIKPNEYRLAHVSPRIPGKAIEVRALLGQAVTAGEILAELDSLELGEKKAAFLTARANLEVARRNFDREKRLFERQISSEKEYLEARGEFERSDAAYRAAREALRLVGLADVEIDKIRWGDRKGEALSHFPLLAPIAGAVIERHITTGELVDAEDKPFTIADLGMVWVEADVYERDLARVRIGDGARVTVDAYPTAVFDGEVTYLSNVVDAQTRTAQARIEVANADGRLRPGMFARVAIASSAGATREELVVPRDAIQNVRDRPLVFVAVGAGSFARREVALGETLEDVVEVRRGLREGERVVTKGAFYLKSTLLKEEMAGHEH